MNYDKITNVVVGGIAYDDYPDFCDAYIESADYDGTPMTQEQLDELNDDVDFVYQAVQDYLF